MSLGPFDLTGEPFLMLYSLLLAAAMVAGFVIPRRMRPAEGAGQSTGLAAARKPRWHASWRVAHCAGRARSKMQPSAISGHLFVLAEC